MSHHCDSMLIHTFIYGFALIKTAFAIKLFRLCYYLYNVCIELYFSDQIVLCAKVSISLQLLCKTEFLCSEVIITD
jgi:hypothetical protein